MRLNLIDQLTEYQRHNIYILQSNDENLLDIIEAVQNEGIPVVNIGRLLSEYLVKLKSAKYIHLEADEHFKKLIESNAKPLDKNRLPVTAIYNLGILMEPAISIDAAKVIKEISKTIAIIIIWDGQIDSSGILHWNEQMGTLQLDFTDTHLKQVNIPYEI